MPLSEALAQVVTPRRRVTGDAIAHATAFAFGLSVMLVAALILFELWIRSAPARAQFVWSFLVSTDWDPVAGRYGALPFVYGTVVTSAIALIIGIPLALGTAIFLAELAPLRVSNALTFLVETLAAIPSVIYGFIAIFLLVPAVRSLIGPSLETAFGFVPLFRGPSFGVSLLTAALVLAIMVIPFIASVSRESLLAVPAEQREAALALGATKWEATWQVVVPYARFGIIGSVFLALARALGETMAVTMVIGNDPRIHASLLAPGYSVAAVIANEFSEATGNLHLSALIELGLVLFIVTAAVNAIARLFILVTARQGSNQR